MSYHNIPVKQVTLVYGEDAEQMNAQQLISKIKALQCIVKSHDEVTVESSYIENEKGKIEAAIGVLVKFLDAKKED